MAILVAVVGLMVMAFAGSALAVVKVGNAGPNRLVGTAENDTLKGRIGADTIIGKGDSDRLYGGAVEITSKPASVDAPKTIWSTAGEDETRS